MISAQVCWDYTKGNIISKTWSYMSCTRRYRHKTTEDKNITNFVLIFFHNKLHFLPILAEGKLFATFSKINFNCSCSNEHTSCSRLILLLSCRDGPSLTSISTSLEAVNCLLRSLKSCVRLNITLTALKAFPYEPNPIPLKACIKISIGFKWYFHYTNNDWLKFCINRSQQ